MLLFLSDASVINGKVNKMYDLATKPQNRASDWYEQNGPMQRKRLGCGIPGETDVLGRVRYSFDKNDYFRRGLFGWQEM